MATEVLGRGPLDVSARRFLEPSSESRSPLNVSSRALPEPASYLPTRFSAMADDANMAKAQKEASMLLSVVEGHLEAGEYKDALKSGRQAMLMFGELGDKVAYPEVVMLMVQSHRLDSQQTGENPEDALNLAKEQLASFEKKGDKRGRACMQLVLAETLAAMSGGRKNLRSAFETIEAAIAIFRDIPEKKLEAAAQLVLSNVHYQRAKAEDAKEAASAALRLFRETGDRRGEAKAHHSMSMAHSITEDFESAVTASKEALQLYEEQGDKRARAFELQVLAQWYMTLKKLPKAVVSAKESLELFRGLKNAQQGEAAALLLTCEAMVHNGRERQALRLAKDTSSRFKSGGDSLSIALGMELLLHAYILVDAREEAQRTASEAVQMVGGIGNKRVALNLLHAACAVFSHCGRIQDALQTMRDALAIAHDKNDPEEEAIALRTICTVHMSSGDIRMDKDVFMDATQCTKDAMLLFSQSGNLSGEGSCATILAMFKNTNKEIIEAAKQSRAIYQDAEDAHGESAALKLLCEAYLVDKSYADAMDATKARLALWKDIGKKSQQADALYKLASVHLMQEEDEQAEQTALQAKSLAREAGATALEAYVCVLLTQAYIMRMSREKLPQDKDAALPPPFVEARRKAYDAINEALDVSGKIDDNTNSMLRASVFFWRSEVLVWSFRGHEALHSALLADKMFSKLGNLSGQVHSQVMIADLHLLMSNKGKAKDIGEAALALAQSMMDSREEQDACQALLVRIEGKKEVKKGGGGTRMVRKMVKKWRKKKSSGAASGGGKSGGLELAMVSTKILKLVKDVVADGEDIAQDDPFMEAGVDSLGSVQLITDVGKAFQMSLSPSVVFDFPTVRSLGEYLVAESGGAEPVEAGGGDDEWEEYEDWEDVEEAVEGIVQVVEQPAIEDDTIALLKAAKPVAAVVEAPKGLDAALVQKKITTLVLNVLAGGEEEIEADNPLMEAGVDSLGSVQLVTDLGKEFSMSLSPSVVFDFPTIRELVGYIVEESKN